MNASATREMPWWARQMLIFIGVASIWLFAAVYALFITGNMFATLVCALGALWFFIAINSDEWKTELQLHSYQRAQRNTYFRNQTHFFVIGLAPALFALLSIGVFMPWFYAYSVIDRGDGMVEYHHGFHVALINPLTTEVRYFSADYTDSTGVVCLGKTSDGRGVRAKVSATLALPFSGLLDAYKMAGNSRQLSRFAESELCSRFAAVVQIYSIDTLPSSLSLESRTADARHGMNNLGLRYAGTISVEGMKAYVVEK